MSCWRASCATFPDRQIAVVAMDPTRRRSGGALLGDRIRMNSLAAESIFMRSLATRRQNLATSAVLKDVIELYKAAGFDLIIVETAGIGQSDTEIVDLVDLSLYVMTSEYGAASQLEKIDMLDFADLIVLNKSEKRGAEDSLRDVRKQWRRNHPDQREARGRRTFRSIPTIASRFNDPGVNRLFAAMCQALSEKQIGATSWQVADVGPTELTAREPLIPGHAYALSRRDRSTWPRRARAHLKQQVEAARRAFGMYEALKTLRDAQLPGPLERYPGSRADRCSRPMPRKRELRGAYNQALDAIGAEGVGELKAWPARARCRDGRNVFLQGARPGRDGRELHRESRRVSASRSSPCRSFRDWGEILHFLRPRICRAPIPTPAASIRTGARRKIRRACLRARARPERTNRRFHYLAGGHGAARLSTAFDSTTLYGEDPDTRPDIYGRTGNSGVSIATLDDMKKLYSGFDLCLPTTSVSMTINGPAPMLLAMFMNTAIDQRVERYLKAEGRGARPRRRSQRCIASAAERGCPPPTYKGELPQGPRRHRAWRCWASPATSSSSREVYERIKAEALQAVRGTVQADILKEDQAQNTCIFSTEFALRMMGDVQQYFIEQQGPELLLGLHLRLSHRRGRRESDLAARLHARERLHDRRVLPGARHEDR